MRLRGWTRFVILALVVASAFGPAGQVGTSHAVSYDGDMFIDCQGFVANNASAWLDRDNTGIQEEHFFLIAWDGAGTVIFYQDSQANLGERVNGIGVASWTTPPQYNPITFQAISAAGNELPEEVGFEATGVCEGLPYSETPVAVPGCDVLMDIPAAAVGGAFVADALIYYAPGMLVDPQMTIQAGNTAWVLGVDASGAYYKIVWGCQYLWVPVSTMGPNFDKVWNGTPLPTGVVS